MSVYLDYNSTTPLAQEVLDVVKSVAESSWFNPSSAYDRKAKDVIKQSRQSVATMLNANPNDFLFTSGGTESNFLVFNTFSQNSSGVLPLVITSNIEHPSVLLPLSRLEMLDLIELKIIPVNPSTGVVHVETVLNELRPNRIILITIMLANNETGAIMPIEEIVRAVRAWESKNVSSIVFIHSDLAQAIGKLPLDLTRLGLDYATIVGHKFYGPRIGCLFVRGLLATKPDAALNWSVTRRIAPVRESGAPLVPLFLGGGQEFGFRSGTENTPMIAGLGKAAELVTQNLDVYIEHMLKMRRYLEHELQSAFLPLAAHVRVCIFGVDRCSSSVADLDFNRFLNGKSTEDPRSLFERFHRLPNTVNLAFIGCPGLDSHQVLALCPALQASRGAACHSALHNSSVLQACGYSVEEAKTAIRLSIGRTTTLDDIVHAVDDLKRAVSSLLSGHLQHVATC
ncbi:hypothetical protein EG68_06872 [Paragonimus skrjabini miyazakii]|uniref:Selenocysteine lyase n=1 Tax=Paragonimus skrjabini miyazakii TaxID=59628 RepID=A0A8S9YN30_9TREM|nr:hypothetical protein EG68_06872 [Paragonimus skrjabini miyazakii]